MYALPQRFFAAGVRRYGFHGLSCEYIMGALRAMIAPLPMAARDRRASGQRCEHHRHLGGCSVETTMGFSPTGGLVMGTRTGDLDPGVLLYALQQAHADADALSRLVNHEAGLLGVSGTSQDMRDLLAREAPTARRDAVALFCYIARRSIWRARGAVLGGLDTLVFTGGDRRARARRSAQRICAASRFFGIELGRMRNRQDAADHLER